MIQDIDIRLLCRNTGQIEGLPKNPRFIRDETFELLKKSIQENPEMLSLRELLVYPLKGEIGTTYVVIGGNMRLEACKALGYKTVPCKVLDADTTVEQLKAYTVKDNAGFGEWDWDMLANEWDSAQLTEWGVDVPEWEQTDEDDRKEIERKLQEFKDRIAAGEMREEDDEYQEFLDKFKLKKTTDDCYTPALVYDAVADWVANTYGCKRVDFVRPFYPGGDYTKEKYPEGCVVVDNPPFSILAEILKHYKQHGVRFFLFAPHLTLFSSSSSDTCTALVTGVGITYENGASVNTSFLTNLEPKNIRAKSCPSLYKVVKQANDANLKELHKELPRYSYDLHVVTSSSISPYSRLGIEFEMPIDETLSIGALDAQKESGKAIYGKGYLISERLFAEREKAEREKAEREKAERWELSDRERAIVAQLSKH